VKPSVTLPNFEGPLELLLYLIQKEELPIEEVSLSTMTKQWIDRLDDVDAGAEFLALASTLLLLKSRSLLPHEQAALEGEEDSRWEMIQKLLEYCHYKEMAKGLADREESQGLYFPRGYVDNSVEKGLGLEEVNLSDLTSLLQDVLAKAPSAPKTIQGETWEIGPKIVWWEQEAQKKPLGFFEVFTPKKCREELIVLFLALLELLKLQKLMINTETWDIQCLTS